MEVATAIRTFARAILHGDAGHREWLLEAAEALRSSRDGRYRLLATRRGLFPTRPIFNPCQSREI